MRASLWSSWGGSARRRARLALLGAYVLLLVLSHALQRAPESPRPDGPGRIAVRIPSQGDRGAFAGSSTALSWIHWPSSGDARDRLPLVCLHGSPGSATNFQRLAPRLAASGRDVWAVDLTGFGASRGASGGTSILAHARAVLAALEAIGIERAHLLGWSLGGGVALHAADLAPERVASIALVASIGVQETEGSGSYAFEHAKYVAWLTANEALNHLVPHFGALSEFAREGRASAINFLETDQRPLRGILQRLAVPALIVHGRGDVLAPIAAAETSHELARSSRLVVLDAGHFLPILQVEELVAELEPFLARHDGAPVPEPRARVDESPAHGWAALDPEAFALGLAIPWWLQVVAIALASAWWPKWTSVLAGAVVGATQIDFGLAVLALAPGACAAALRKPPRSVAAGAAAPFRAWGWMLLVLALCVGLDALASLLELGAPRLAAPCIVLLVFLTSAFLRRSRSVEPELAVPTAR
jgi:pimeloyl-ACP methyl ester carboxylesterase